MELKLRKQAGEDLYCEFGNRRGFFLHGYKIFRTQGSLGISGEFVEEKYLSYTVREVEEPRLFSKIPSSYARVRSRGMFWWKEEEYVVPGPCVVRLKAVPVTFVSSDWSVDGELYEHDSRSKIL